MAVSGCCIGGDRQDPRCSLAIRATIGHERSCRYLAPGGISAKATLDTRCFVGHASTCLFGTTCSSVTPTAC